MKKPKPEAQKNDQAVAQSTAKPATPSIEDIPPTQETLDPTTTELALIAASLHRGARVTWENLSREAYSLWDACRQEIASRREARRRPFDELRDAIPTPTNDPVMLPAFLKLTLPRRRVPDRSRAYRHFLMDWKNLSFEKAGDLMEKHMKTPMASWEYFSRAHVFLAWIKADFSCGKRLNAVKGRMRSSHELIAAEEKKASEERRQAATQAEEEYRDLWKRSNILLGLC